MFVLDDEERDDQDLDNDDADADNNSEDDEEEDDESDEDDSDSDEDDSDDEDDEDDDESDDKSKKSKKDGDDSNKGKKNRDNARDRIAKKNRNTSDDSDTAERLSKLEKSERQRIISERKRTFGYENNLSPKQVDYAFRLSKRPTAKFLKQPEVAAGLAAIKASENVSSNTPSNRGRIFKNDQGKPKAWTKLKPEERQSRFADRRRAILESKR